MRKYFLAMLFLPVFAFSVSAQEAPAPIADEAIKATIVATVEVYNAQILSQDADGIKIGFDLFNQENVQPDIQYSVSLIKEDGDNQETVDTKVYLEKITLGVKQTVSKNITYQPPKYLSGNYQLWLIAKNGSGLTLGLSNLGEVSLSGNNEFVEVDFASCRYSINEQPAQSDALILEEKDQLEAVCEITNHFPRNIHVFPVINIFQKSLFGKKIIETKDDQAIFFESGEKKTISFSIPKVDNLQYYLANLKLAENEQIVSNEINFNFFRKGDAVSIENLRLNKDYYQKGEIAEAVFFLMSSSDSKIFVDFSITGEKNNSCIKQETRELDAKNITPTLAFPIISECANPKVAVQIKDGKGKILDEKEVSIISRSISQSTASEKNDAPISGVILFAIAFTVALLLVVFFAKKNGLIKMIFFFLLAGGMFFGGGEAKAWTAALPNADCADPVQGTWGSISPGTATVSFNKNSYTPGESITVNGSVTTYTESYLTTQCTKSTGVYSVVGSIGVGGIKVDHDSPTVSISPASKYDKIVIGQNISLGETINKSISTIAPSVPGSYYGGVYFCASYMTYCGGWGGVIPYTVVAPTCTGSIPSSASAYDSEESSSLIANSPWAYSASDTSTKCQYKCNSGYSWSGSSCVAVAASYSCTGSIPSSASAYDSEESSSLTANSPWSYSASDTSTKCQYKCNSGYSWNGSSCVALPAKPTGLSAICNSAGTSATITWDASSGATEYATRYDRNTSSWSGDCYNLNTGDYCGRDSGRSYTAATTPGNPNDFWVHACNSAGDCSNPTDIIFTCNAPASYSCTGSIPSNASMFDGDNIGLTANTPYTHWVTDTGTRCQYHCNSGYSWSGSSCVAVAASYSCTGSIPSNASMFSGDNIGLTANTPYTHWVTDTGTRCQYHCNSGYSWNGSSCVAVPPVGLNQITANPVSISEGESTVIDWNSSYNTARIGYKFRADYNGTDFGSTAINQLTSWAGASGSKSRTLYNSGRYKFILYSDNYTTELDYVYVDVNNSCSYSNYQCISSVNIDCGISSNCGSTATTTKTCVATNSCTGGTDTRPNSECNDCASSSTSTCPSCPSSSGGSNSNWIEVAP
jgi:hypothetical protein